MRDTLGRALDTYAAEGATELTRRMLQYLLRTAYFRVSDDTFRLHQQVRNELFEAANLNSVETSTRWPHATRTSETCLSSPSLPR